MNNQSQESQLMQTVQMLKAKGIPDAQIAEVISAMGGGAPEMSRRDGVTMTVNEGNVPGGYVDAYQQAQDAYINSGRAQIDAKVGMQAPGFFPTTADMNSTVIPVYNPNAKTVVDGSRTAVKSDGTIVHY